VATAAALLAAVLFFLPAPAGEAPGVMHAAAVVTLTIGLLGTVALPEFLTVLMFFFLSVVLAVAPPNVVFSGFFSGALWLVFGGLIIGVAIDETGLGKRIAGTLVRLFAGSYAAMIFGTVWGMTLLSFLMPSSVGRIVIMLPIVLALAERLGFERGSRGRAGLALAVGTGSLIPTFAILPASVPNVAMAGAAEAIHGLRFSYSEYLVLHFPVIGLVSLLALPVFLLLLFPARTIPVAGTEKRTRLSAGEGRLIMFLVTALALWATDSIHGVAPAWISLGAGIICVMPGVGVIAPGNMMQKLNFGPILFLAGVIGMGAVVTHTGLGRLVGGALLEVMPLQGSGLQRFASLVGLGVGMGVVTTLPGQPAIMTALAETLAQGTGWPLLTVVMAQVPSWALMMFPYQAPPMVVTMAISRLPVSQFLRILLPFALFGWAVMVPLQYLWWRYLGYIPAAG
jgi:di/tricarboxylate transporter